MSLGNSKLRRPRARKGQRIEIHLGQQCWLEWMGMSRGRVRSGIFTSSSERKREWGGEYHSSLDVGCRSSCISLVLPFSLERIKLFRWLIQGQRRLSHPRPSTCFARDNLSLSPALSLSRVLHVETRKRDCLEVQSFGSHVNSVDQPLHRRHLSPASFLSLVG